MTTIPATTRRSPGAAGWLRIALGMVAAAVAALLLLAAVRIVPLLLAPNDYEGVRSIELRTDYRAPALMERAWALPVARAYRAGGYEYQGNPSFCGPASVANLLQSLGAAVDQQAVIEGTAYDPWFGVLLGGLTIDELADLVSRRLGRPARIVRDPDLADFRAWLKRSNRPDTRMIVNFHRGPLFGRGHGHFSPVLGYLEAEDLVLVGDVNADYRPFLVRSETLWRGTDTIDAETGLERGLIVVDGKRRRA